MKRFVKVFLILALVSAIGYWGFKQLKHRSSLVGKIHINADSALKIGVQEIKETLVFDALTSPGYYFDKASFKGTDDKEKIESGINFLPYNIVFYTLPEVKNTFFGTFSISDSEAFEVYAQKELDKRSITIEEVAPEGYRFAKMDKSKVAFAWNTEKLVVAFAPELRNSAIQKVFKEVLTEGKTIEDSKNALIEALADSNDHMVYVQDKSKVTINFEDGKAIVDGDIRTAIAKKYQPEISIESMENPSFQLYFDANFENKVNKEEWLNKLNTVSFFAKNNLRINEVLDRTNGFLSLSIAGKTTQIDTIITYDYDENFEKVEKRSLQEKEVPKIHMNLGAEDESLKAYLTAQKAVNDSSVFEAFPLYQLFVKDGPMNTAFDTYKGRISSQEKLKNTFFGCQLNFKKLSQDIDLPMAKKTFENLEELKLLASQKDGNHVVLSGELTAKDSGINILSQFALPKQQDSVQ